ncbi:hypothetical protein AAU57_08450 [Nonlabens sp. YIK11]|uniref:T9SS type A sorting domain-containing protein n=1 Tax=Nonlabens sp. YIK11 TaxID=1453349 RepID=UPI0006DD15D5|nr:T9SS type A sorting domain-containing protein [Nonlabens sp. YIK11]KQC33341.1 hypothetical protein AAU57_08450 [Nonlabens sp. YIK11]
MKTFLLYLLLVFPVLAVCQTFEFNNSADGWTANNASLSTNANSITLTLTADQNAQLETTTAGIDATANSILAIRMRNSSEVSVLKVRSERLETTGVRFTPFDVEPFNLAYTTYFFDLDNSEWDNNNTPGATQNNLTIFFRGPGDIVNPSDGTVEIDRIAFISRAEREDFTFELDANDEGWIGQAGSSIETINGALKWTVDGTTNLARLQQSVFSVDAANKYVHVFLQNNTQFSTLRLRYNSSTNADAGMNVGQPTGYNSYQVITLDLTADAGWNGLISDIQFQARNFTGTGSPTGTIIIERILFDNEPTFNQPIIYSAGQFDPTANVTATDDLIVKDALTLSGDLDVRNLTVQNNGSLNAGSNVLNVTGDIIVDGSIELSTASLNLSGSTSQLFKSPDVSVENVIINNAEGVLLNTNLDLTGTITLTNGVLTTQNSSSPTGVLTFKSSEGKSAVLDQVVSGSINGTVTVEKFFPATTGRKFRFVSAPVNFRGSIYDNWQEAGDATAGFGVQITGGTAADGYDQSTSGNPSLFRFENDYTNAADAWTPLTSDNGDNLTTISPVAGDAYRMFIRGDRTTDLTTNTDPASQTILRASGTLATGTYPASPITLAGSNLYSLIGNPYQSKVDVQALLAGATNVNTAEYYQWDPTTNNYVLYEFATPTVPSGSEITGNALPGQSFFVQSDATGNGSLQFQESYKVADSDVATKNSTVNNQLTINLSTQEQAANGKANDIAIARFDEEYDSNFTTDDTSKFFGLSHSLAWENEGAYYIVNRASVPVDGDTYGLNVFVGESADYTFTLDLNGVDGINTYFHDKLDDSFDLVTVGESTSITKNIDLADANSGAVDRFEIVFSKSTLGVDDSSAFAKAISIYPNPLSGNTLFIKGMELDGDSSVSLTNLAGQVLFETSKLTESANVRSIKLPEIAAGIYIVNVNQNDKQASYKLIIQ